MNVRPAHSPVSASIALAFLISCGPPLSKEDVTEAVKARFAVDNPPGRTGLELVGKAVWLRASFFDDRCIEEKDLAFNDLPSKRPKGSQGVKRISPTYENQRYLTAATEKGFCVYLGEDPTLTIDDALWLEGKWRLRVTYGMEKPTPWFECLSDLTRQREIVIPVEEGKPVFESSLALTDDTCPHPLPPGEDRKPKQRPTARPDTAPTRQAVSALFTAFDKALYDQDLEKALGMVSCYNLFEKEKYGTCSAGEIVNLGPLPRNGKTRPSDGPPWLEYISDTADGFTAIGPDSADKTMFHARFKPRRTGKERSVGLQWVGGQWKIVGVVSNKAESITTMRIVYDLDRAERRTLFERRMKGELIDEQGIPYDPYTKPQE